MSKQHHTVIAELRAVVASAERRSTAGLPFGVAALDDGLVAGGLATAALHEVAATTPDLACDAAATLFLAGAVSRVGGDAPVLWALTRFDLYAPGLEQVGLSAARTIYAEVRDDAEALAVAEDALAHGGAAAVVADVSRAGMTATRRLQLAAERAHTPVMLLRRWRKRGVCPLSEPSAAATRWRIGTARSASLAVPGLGRARWNVELVRQRGGEPFSLVLEACDGEGRLALAADRAVAVGGASAARAA